jgi:hypothetical protein
MHKKVNLKEGEVYFWLMVSEISVHGQLANHGGWSKAAHIVMAGEQTERERERDRERERERDQPPQVPFKDMSLSDLTSSC